MKNFLATVLSVIAVGVLLIAYGLLSPRVAAMDVYPQVRPMLASERIGDLEVLTPRQPMAYRANGLRAPEYDTRSVYDAPRSTRTVAERQVTRTAPRRVVSSPPQSRSTPSRGNSSSSTSAAGVPAWPVPCLGAALRL